METKRETKREPNTSESLTRKQRAIAVLSNIMALLRGGWFLSFREFVKELEVLGLQGAAFGPKEYLYALEQYLRITIKVEICPLAEFPVERQKVERAGFVSCLGYDGPTRTATITVLDTLSWVSTVSAVYHELAHIAAGHHLESVDPEHLSEPEYVSHKYPNTEYTKQEREANLRAAYCFVAGVLAERSVSAMETLEEAS